PSSAAVPDPPRRASPEGGCRPRSRPVECRTPGRYPIGRASVMNHDECPKKAQHLLQKISHKRIEPPALMGSTSVAGLIDEAFLSYNAGRLREACKLFTTKMLAPDSVVGLSLSGALTPAGLGMSALVPLLEAGFVDWMISTGANLYHDTHFALE